MNFNGTFNNFDLGFRDTYQKSVNYVSNQYEAATDTFNKFTLLQKVIAIIAFILVIIIFILIIYFMRKKDTMEGKVFMTGIENNNPHNSKEIYRYYNPLTERTTSYIPGNLVKEINGTQYTYSFWVFIDGINWNYKFDDWKHIFHKGTRPTEQIYELENGKQTPGFWLSPRLNRLNCVMSTDRGVQKVILKDLELNKWINISMVLNTNTINLYKDGLLERTAVLEGNVYTTEDNIYINYYGGFSGNMAFLQFYNRILDSNEIQKIYEKYKKYIDKYIDFRIKQRFKDEDKDEQDEDEDIDKIKKDSCPIKVP